MKSRPKRENYAVGQFGENDYQEMLERYCTYLENQNKQLRIDDVSQQRELLQAVEDLVEFARNNCREWNIEEMEDIIDRL